jgi:hypothetical protein
MEVNLFGHDSSELLITPLRKKTKKDLNSLLKKIPGTKVEWHYEGGMAIQLNHLEDGIIAGGSYNIYSFDGIINIMENKHWTLPSMDLETQGKQLGLSTNSNLGPK